MFGVPSDLQHSAALVCAIGTARVALPLASVIEVMRPLPIEAVGVRGAVRGVSIIRGAPTVVVDGVTLLGQPAAEPVRFVTLRTGTRVVALAVQGVEGVQWMARDEVHALPPLLREADADALDHLAARDGELLAVLRTSHLLAEAEGG